MLNDKRRLEDFPSLSGRVYLNTAAESIPPNTVFAALERYWRDKQKGMIGRDNHFAELEACRETASRLLEKAPEEIAFCSCSSEAYNLLASALDLSGSDEVVISDLDFPAGATPWLRLGKQPKVNLWKNQDGVLELDELEPLLSEKTRLVQVSLVSFLTGYRIPWAPFRDLVRRLAPNAILSVDITQAFGRVALDCLDADCVISSTHKWILGFHGGCVVAVSEQAADRLTTRAGGWYHIENAFEADRFEKAIPKPGAASFSVGMPNFPAIYALNAGMTYLEEIGIKNVAAHADPIIARLHEGLANLGVSTMSPPQPDCSSGIVSFQHPQDEAINQDLLENDIHVMRQAGRIRVAIHGYNRMEEIEPLFEVLKKWT